jgi:tetratricopeptide (TPR) repeat protein
MRPEHRHELKTNELAEWINNFPQWARENLRMIIYVSVVIILVAAAYFWKIYQKNVVIAGEQFEFTRLVSSLPRSKIQILYTQNQGVDSSYILLNPAKGFQTLAQNTKNDLMAALALIERGEALRMELHYRLGPVSDQDLVAQINRAKASYNEAISRLTVAKEHGKTDPSLVAMADLGLGLCEEELGNFDQARQIYRDITTNNQFEPTTAFAAAKQRLETMDDYKTKVVFKPSPKPTTTVLPQPQIKQQLPEINAISQSPNSVPESTVYLREIPNEVNSLRKPPETANGVPNLPPLR